jgi:HSP20 family protein
MAIDRWRPFGTLMERDPFRDIQGEVNRLFDSFLGRPAGTATGTGSRVWMPVVDLYETNDDLVLNFELPGVQEKDIALSFINDMRTVRGERHLNQTLKDDSYLHMERVYGKFERSMQLPKPIQADRATATFHDGVLEVKLPKAEAVKLKEIKIGIG